MTSALPLVCTIGRRREKCLILKANHLCRKLEIAGDTWDELPLFSIWKAFNEKGKGPGELLLQRLIT